MAKIINPHIHPVVMDTAGQVLEPGQKTTQPKNDPRTNSLLERKILRVVKEKDTPFEPIVPINEPVAPITNGKKGK